MTIALPANRLSHLQTSAIDLLEQVLSASAAQLQSSIKSPDPALLREARLVAESALKILSTVDLPAPPLASPLAPLTAPSAAPNLAPATPSPALPPGDVAMLHPRTSRSSPRENIFKQPARPSGLQHFNTAPARALLSAVGATKSAHPP